MAPKKTAQSTTAAPLQEGLAKELQEAPPAKVPRLDADAAPSVRPAPTTEESLWPRWVDPGDEGAQQVNTYKTMKILVPWLRQELPAHLKRLGLTSGGKVEAVSPLEIQASTDSSALSSYKEVWTPANCKVAIDNTDMYEAGGSLMWLDPGFVGEFVSLLHAEPAWSVVGNYQKEFFSREACNGRGRLLFPCVLEAYSVDEGRDWSKMPLSLCLLGGQAIVFAWYVAAARAMLASDDALLRELWQAALTCTIQLQRTTSVSKLALPALELSERYVGFADMADTFPHWGTKIQRIIDNIDGVKKLSSQVVANHLRDMGVRFRGTPVTKAMILSVGHVHELFDESSFTTLRQIEKEFGRDVLSTNYTKLSRFMAVLKNHAMSVATHGKIKEVPPLSKTQEASFNRPTDGTLHFQVLSSAKYCGVILKNPCPIHFDNLMKSMSHRDPTGMRLCFADVAGHAARPWERHRREVLHPRGPGREGQAARVGADDDGQIPSGAAAHQPREQCPELDRYADACCQREDCQSHGYSRAVL